MIVDDSLNCILPRMLSIKSDDLPSRMDLEAAGDQMVLSTSAGSEVALSFFDELVSALESAGATALYARLFDSSSGGVQVWRYPDNEDDDIDLDGADILFLGDMEEDIDEMKELAQEMGVVHDEWHEQISLVVLGQNIAPAEMSKILKTGVRTITEDQFWDYIADEPM
jgi:hypothetical protein